MEKINQITHMEPGKRIHMPISEELRERVRMADKCIVMIFMMDTVVLAQIEKMMYRAIEAAREEGIYRQELKRDLNEIKKIIDRRRHANNGNSIESYLDVLNNLLPQSKVRFNTYATRPEDYLLSSFIRKSGSIMKNTEDDFAELMTRNGFNHTKMLSTIAMIYGLCFKALDIHHTQYSMMMQNYNASDVILTNRGRLWKYIEVRINQSKVNEPMLSRIMNISASIMKRLSIDRELVCDKSYEQKMEDSIASMRSVLSYEEIYDVVDGTLSQMSMDYIEFYLACLRMDMLEDGKVDKHYRATLARYVGEERVDELLGELSQVEPMRDGEDMIDLQQRLPDGSEESAIRKFRESAYNASVC